MDINLNGSGIGINNYSEVLIVKSETRNTFCADNTYDQDKLSAYANQLAFKNINSVCPQTNDTPIRVVQSSVSKTSQSTFPRIVDNALLGNCIESEALSCKNESLPLDVHFIIDLSTSVLSQISNLPAYLDNYVNGLIQTFGSGLRFSYSFLTPSDSQIDTSTTWTLQFLSNYSSTGSKNTGITLHQSVACATVESLAVSYYNGNLGLGATLTALDSSPLGRIDGYQPKLNDRILVKDQSSQIYNGIYVVTDLGGVNKPWVLIRSDDFNGTEPVLPGWATVVQNGTTNIGQEFVQTGLGTATKDTHAISFGVDSVIFKNITEVQFTCDTPSIVDFLNANGTQLYLNNSNSSVCPYDIILQNLIDGAFTYGTVVTDASVIKAKAIKKCKYVRRALAYLQVVIISNRSITLSEDNLVATDLALNAAQSCSINITPIIVDGQITVDFPKTFELYQKNNVNPSVVFNNAEVFTNINGQIKKYYDGLFLNIANANNQLIYYANGNRLYATNAAGDQSQPFNVLFDYVAYNYDLNLFVYAVSNTVYVLKNDDIVATYDYPLNIVGLFFDRFDNLIILDYELTAQDLYVIVTPPLDLINWDIKYTVNIASYGTIPFGSIKYFSPPTLTYDFLTFGNVGDSNLDDRFMMALSHNNDGQITEILPWVGSYIGFDIFLNRFYILDAINQKILRFDDLSTYFYDGLTTSSSTYDISSRQIILNQNSGELLSCCDSGEVTNPFVWKKISTDGIITTTILNYEVEQFVGINNNLSCPEEYDLLPVHKSAFGGISSWQGRDAAVTDLLVSQNGSVFKQYFDLKVGSTYVLTIEPIISDLYENFGNIIVSLGFTNYTYQLSVRRTGPISILFNADGGPCVLKMFTSPFFNSTQVAFKAVLLCESTIIACGRIDNLRVTFKWGTTNTVDVPRLPVNLFNAFIRLKYRDPLKPSSFKYTYIVPNCEGHTCLGDVPKDISKTCNYGDTVDFWKQQGLGGLAQSSILKQNLTLPYMESVTKNKAMSVVGVPNWLFSVPQSTVARVNDELDIYFPSYEDQVNILDTIDVFILANQVYPTGEFPSKNCEDFLPSVVDPGSRLSVLISYDDQKNTTHQFVQSFARNELYTTYDDFEQDTPSYWDTLTSLGHGVKGSKAGWLLKSFVLDTPDGKQPDGSPTLNQCSKPLKVVLSGQGELYVLPGPAKPAPGITMQADGFIRRPCSPQMRFDMISQGSVTNSLVSFGQPNATGGSYKVYFNKSNNGVIEPEPYVFEFNYDDTPSIVSQLLSSAPGFVTGVQDIGVSGVGSIQDPFLLAFINRSQGYGYSILKTDGTKLLGAGTYTTEVLSSGGLQNDVFSVKFKTNSEAVQSLSPDSPVFQSYTTQLYLQYGNTIYSPPPSAGAISGEGGITAASLLEYINNLVDSNLRSFGSVYGQNFVNIGTGANANFGPFSINFPTPLNNEKAVIYFKTTLISTAGNTIIDSRNKLSYDPVSVLQTSVFGQLIPAKQRVRINASGGSFRLGLPANSTTTTSRGLYVVVSYEYPNKDGYTSSATFNLIASGLDKDSTGNFVEYFIVATPDRCNTTSQNCDAFLAFDKNIALNQQYLKSKLRGINGVCANNVYTTINEKSDAVMSSWVSKIVDSFDLTITTNQKFAPNVNMSSDPLPSLVPDCDIKCIVRIFVDNGTNDTNTLTQIFSQTIQASKGIEYTRTFKVMVPKQDYVYTDDIPYNSSAQVITAAIRAVQSATPSDAIVQLNQVVKESSKAEYLFTWNNGYAILPLAVDTKNLTGGVVNFSNLVLGSYQQCVQRLTLQTVSAGYFNVNVTYGGRSGSTSKCVEKSQIAIPFKAEDLQFALLCTQGAFPVDALSVHEINTDDPYLTKIYDVVFAPFMGAVPLMEVVTADANGPTIACYPLVIPVVPAPPYKMPMVSCVEGPEDLLFSFCGVTGDGSEPAKNAKLTSQQLASKTVMFKTRAELVNPDNDITLKQMLLKTNSGLPKDFICYKYDSINQIMVRVDFDTKLVTQSSYIIISKDMFGSSYGFSFSTGPFEDANIDRIAAKIYIRARSQTNLIPGRIVPQQYVPKPSTYLLAPVVDLKCPPG